MAGEANFISRRRPWWLTNVAHDTGSMHGKSSATYNQIPKCFGVVELISLLACLFGFGTNVLCCRTCPGLLGGSVGGIGNQAAIIWPVSLEISRPCDHVEVSRPLVTCSMLCTFLQSLVGSCRTGCKFPCFTTSMQGVSFPRDERLRLSFLCKCSLNIDDIGTLSREPTCL